MCFNGRERCRVNEGAWRLGWLDGDNVGGLVGDAWLD